MMSKPNFFIVGAPKCGTTALSEYLRDHKNIFVSTPKEIHYFATDFPKYRRVVTEQDYLALFDNATKEHFAIGEASVFYLYSQTAIKNISQFNKDTKIIIMLRNPIELAYSMHSQLVYGHDEDETDFYKAWELIKNRKKGQNIPKKCREQKFLYYDDIAKLGQQLKQVLEVIPKERILVLFSEDFFGDTLHVYKEVLKFLGVPDDNRQDFPKFNQNKYHKLAWLGSLTQRPPKKFVNVVLKLKNAFGIEKLSVLRTLRSINSKQAKRKPLEKEFKQKLKTEYSNDIATLSKLTGRDLTHWLE